MKPLKRNPPISRYARVVMMGVFLLVSFRSVAINYIDYYRAVAGAEKDIVDHRYKEAIKQYDSIFASYPYNNPIDCYVAAQVAGYVGDTAACHAFLANGLSFGLPLQTISSNPHLAQQLNKETGLGQVKIDSCLQVYHGSINKEARTKVLELIRQDQFIVKTLPFGGLYTRDGLLRPEYKPIWDTLVGEVKTLIRTVGFPSQKIIGTQDGNDGMFIASPHSAYVYYMFIHHTNAWNEVKDMLRPELEKGNITPQMYAAIADYSNGSVSDQHKTYFAMRPSDKRTYEKWVRPRISAIDESRYQVGLCPYEVAQQKFTSTIQYRKWRAKKETKAEPVFDFQPDLHFMNIDNS